jgi:glucose/arabinose dehydrogenase
MYRRPRFAVLFFALVMLLGASARAIAEPIEQSIAFGLISEDFDHPVHISPLSNDPNSLIIAERTGQVVRFSKRDDSSEELLNIENLINEKLTRGLLGVSLPLGIDGQIFINYIDTQGDLVVGRFSSAKKEGLDENDMSVVIKVAHISRNSQGSQLAFARDGSLFISTGDGQAAADRNNSGAAQAKNTLLGKILRITPRDTSRYEIPTTNPFYKQPPALDEIWALGFRNPEQISLDLQSERIFAIDNSDSTLEINLVQRGGNYGWNTTEGAQCRVSPCSTEGLTAPIISMPRKSQSSKLVAGGVYRGKLFPQLSERFIFAESSSGTLYAAQEAPQQVWQLKELGRLEHQTITALGQDANGELYVATSEGALFEVKPSNKQTTP